MPLAVGVAPGVEGYPGPHRVVVAPAQRDVLVAQFRLFEQEPAQVVLGRQGLGEDHDLAPGRRPVHDHALGPEGMQGRRQEVVRDVVVEGALVRAHAVLEELRPPPDEGPVQKLLCLPPQRALNHGGEPPPQLLRLVRGDATAVVGAEDVLEHGLVPEQRAARVDVLDEPPQFAQGVLDRRRRQEQNGRCADHPADSVRHLRLRALLVVDAGPVVTAVNPGEDLVRLVDQAEVLGRGREARRSCLATGVLALREKHALPFGIDRRFGRLDRLDVEQVDQLGLPLPEERTRNDDEDARRALGEQLGDHEARLDRLAESDLVREDAAALRNPPQGEHHRVDLVGIRVHAAPALRRHLAATFAGAALADEVFGVVAAVDWVWGHGWGEV